MVKNIRITGYLSVQVTNPWFYSVNNFLFMNCSAILSLNMPIWMNLCSNT